MKKQVINSKGDVVTLNTIEQGIADSLQVQVSAPHVRNALGFEANITTLTEIIKAITDQKFFEIAPADFIPMKVGEGAWNTQLTKFLSFNMSDDFETGLLNTGASNSRLAEADAGVEPVNVKILPWAKSIGWSLMDLKFAAQSGQWDVVSSKERSRKKNWDLGIQKIAFLGSNTDSSVKGLLTQADVNSNTSLITKYINTMTTTELNAFVAGVYEAYRANCVRTAKPTHFAIPEADYNGLINFPDTTYPIKTRLEILNDAFKTITGNQSFKIAPLYYADAAANVSTVGGLNRYALYNADEDSLRMDIPVDYTSTIANTINGFQFQNVAYGQFTGCKAYRPLEMLYFDWS